MKAITKKAIETKLGLKVYGNMVSINETLYPVPLVKGNSKLGKNVYHSSTLPTNKTVTCIDKQGNEISEQGTCPATCKGCYGTTGHYKQNSVKYYAMMRTKLLKNYPEIYFQLVAIQLECEQVEKSRIHAIGDFIPGEAMGFYKAMKELPHIKSWTYTKVENDPDIELLNSLPNVNVVQSVIKGWGYNYGHVAYIAALYYYLKRNNESVYICRCGIDPEQHCSDCDGCSDHKYVLFLEHSTGYNPKTDYGYDKFVQLVNNQE